MEHVLMLFFCHVWWLSRHQILFFTLWDNPHVPKALCNQKESSGGFLGRQRRRMCHMLPCYGLCHCWHALDTVLRLSVLHEQFCPIRDAYPVCLRAADCQSEGCQPSSAVTSLCLLGVPFYLKWSMKVLLVTTFKFSSWKLFQGEHESNFSCFLVCTSGYTEPVQDRTQSQEFISFSFIIIFSFFFWFGF